MQPFVYLNGRYLPMDQAQVPVMDRGFLFADAVYEVIPFFQGVGFRLEEHLERLRYSLDAVGINLELDWLAVFDRLIELNPGPHQAIYLQVSRGVMPQRMLSYTDDMQPTVFAYSYPIRMALEGPLDQVAGVRAVTVADQRWGRCDIKTTGLLANVMAIREARRQGVQEVLLVRNGLLTEGASCNVFLVEQGHIYTPEMDLHALAGTTRGLLLELIEAAGLACSEQAIGVGRLESAEEVWISSSTRGVLPVVEINGHWVAGGKPGPIWMQIAERFQQFQQQLLSEHENNR